MNILFWTSSNDGSSWYRADQPAQALQWSGHRTRVTQRVSNVEAQQADVVVISRPAAPQVLDTIPKLKHAHKRVVADLDDDYFAIDNASNPVAAKFWNERMLDNLRHGLGLCDAITVATERIGTSVRNALLDISVKAPPIHVIPNGLHAAYLGLPREYQKDELVIGWSGSGNTATWVPEIATAVNTALAKNPNVKFMAVGVPRHVLHNHLGIENVPGRVGVVEWAPHGEKYLATVANFDVWLAPYADIQFNRAKFATKALEAGMLGIPLIASDVPPYAEWLTTGNGFIAKRGPDWARQLSYLIQSPELRQQVGVGARARASQNIMQQLGRDWSAILEGKSS